MVLLFQSVREILFNVVKHAWVNAVNLKMMRDETDQLCIVVSDQGAGFDPSALGKGLHPAAGFGLLTVRDRLTMLGGHLEVNSTPGVGEASDGEEAVQLALQLRPDVILMDVSMPKLNGLEATQVIHSKLPRTRIIGLSMLEADDQAVAMLRAGAAAYLSKTCDAETILTAIRESAVENV